MSHTDTAQPSTRLAPMLVALTTLGHTYAEALHVVQRMDLVANALAHDEACNFEPSPALLREREQWRQHFPALWQHVNQRQTRREKIT